MHDESKPEGAQHDAAIRAAISLATWEILAELQARGAVVSKELLTDSLIEAIKQWIDSPQARDLIEPATDAAFDKWNAANEAKAN